MNKKITDKKGQILIESLVAISVIIIGLLGIFDLLSRSLSLNRTVGDQYIASNLAAEGIEIIKNIIDSNSVDELPWNNGISNGLYEIVYNDSTPNISRQISSDPNNCTVDFINQNDPNFLTLDETTGLYGYGLPKTTSYKRIVCINNLTDEIKVSSIVTWNSRGASFDINLEDHFFNWRP